MIFDKLIYVETLSQLAKISIEFIFSNHIKIIGIAYIVNLELKYLEMQRGSHSFKNRIRWKDSDDGTCNTHSHSFDELIIKYYIKRWIKWIRKNIVLYCSFIVNTWGFQFFCRKSRFK